MPDITMKEHVFYWIRVVILAGILLFILIGCTVWASPLSGAAEHAVSGREMRQAAGGKGANLDQRMLVNCFGSCRI
jgi:hypothetical protein